MHDVASLMALWPSVSDFARDIGIAPTHAHVMKLRGSIPPAHWSAVVSAAEARGFSDVSMDVLASFVSRRSSRSSAQTPKGAAA